MVACLKFFLGKDVGEKDSDDSDSENEIDPKEVMMANKFNKKTRKREKHLDKVKKLAAKSKKKKSQAPIFNFSALHLIHDPQGRGNCVDILYLYQFVLQAWLKNYFNN